nr:MAG TPA: hypothetical protein [Bacteriophage sp.]
MEALSMLQHIILLQKRARLVHSLLLSSYMRAMILM